MRCERATASDDFWGGTQARIELAPHIDRRALDGLEEFSHIEVLFHFHDVDAARIEKGARHPRNNLSWPNVGIFAQRAKGRPNRLGTSMTRLVRRDARALTVAELGAIDGTPVLDLKPVLAEFLPRAPVRQPIGSHELMRDYWSRAR